MACTLYFTIGDENPISVKTNFTELDFSHPEKFLPELLENFQAAGNTDTSEYEKSIDIYDLIAKAYADSSNLLKTKIVEAVNLAKSDHIKLKDSDYDNDLISLPGGTTIKAKIVPNYSYNRLKQDFPTVTFGEHTPPILVVSGKHNFGKEFTFGKRVIQDGKELFVIPKNQIYTFANYTLLMDQVELIRLGKIQVPEEVIELMLNISLELQDRSKKLTGILKQKEKYIETKKLAFLDDIKKRTTLIRWNRTWTSISEVQALLALLQLELENALKQLEKALKSKDEELIKKYSKEVRTLTKTLDTKTKSFNRQIEQNKTEIANDLAKIQSIEGTSKKVYTDDKIKLFDKLYNEIQTATIPKFNTVAQLIKWYALNEAKLDTLISANNAILLKNFCNQLIGRKVRTLTGDVDFDKINTSIIRYGENNNFKISLDINTFINYCKSIHKLPMEVTEDNITEEELKTLLNTLYLGKQHDLQYAYKTDSEIVFKRKFPTLQERFGFSISEMILLKPLPETYRGYYIYNFKKDRKDYWTYSSTVLNEYSNTPIKSTEAEIKLLIDNSFEKTNIYLLSTIFLDSVDLYTYDDDTNGLGVLVLTPPQKFYNRGLIILAINYPSGNIKIPYNFKVKDFYDWLDTVFTPEDASELKNILLSVNEIAKFYTHFGHTQSYLINSIDYNRNISHIKEIAKLIASAPTLLYEVVDSTFLTTISSGKYTNTANHTRFILVNPREIWSTSVTSLNQRQSDYSYFKAILKIFGDNGIKVNLMTQRDLEEHGFRSDANAFLRGGVIYLNTDRASIHHLFHEYSHLLIQLLKHSNPNMYNQFLLQFFTTIKDGQKRLDDKKDLYKDELLNRRAKGEIVTDDQFEMEMIEEMFADSYSEYLRHNFRNKSLESIFSKVTTVASKHNIFDGVNDEDFLKGVLGRFDLFDKFSTLIREARSTVGFQIPTTIYNLNMAKKILKLASADITEEGLISECE